MNVLVVRFRLNGLDHDAYATAASQMAPEIAQAPGLVTKWWIDGAETGVYGGVYLFTNQESIDQYLASPGVAGFFASGVPVDLQSEVFDVLDAPTAITAGPVAASFMAQVAA